MAEPFNPMDMINNPWSQIGMSLLGASRQQNPYQAAMNNMQQMQAVQQQAALFAMQQKRLKDQEEEKARRNQFLQQSQDQILQAGPPSPAQQQQLTNIGGLQAGLSTPELGAIQGPEPVDQLSQRRKQIIPIGGDSYLDLADGQIHQVPGANQQRQPMPTQLGRTIAEREALPQDSEYRKFYDAELNKRVEQLNKKTGSAATSAARIPMEVIRMDIGADNADKALDRFEQAVKDFDPRNPLDQADMKKRGAIESIAAEILLQGKEAVALGALQQADIQVMERALATPTSGKAIILGRDGILAQVREARKTFQDRRETMRKRYPGMYDSSQPAPEAQSSNRTIVREGVQKSTGKRVIEYSDGTREYAN